MPRAGDVIGGKYELLRELGRGGMGVVFEAAHVELGGRVAIKFLGPSFAGDPESLERFFREARAAAAIGHEAIVAVHDIGATDDGLPFMVLELLRGRSLAERLAVERCLAPSTAAYVACQVLSALAAAHAKGIVHRDLKPANIFLTEGSGALLPGVKLFDFGIARLVGPQGLTSPRGKLTRTGVVIGTPEYMSPEQARGMPDVDHRSDLFSLGVILYEALTGALPFSGSSCVELLTAIIQATPEPLSGLRPGLPPRLEAAVGRALAKDPGERHATAQDFFVDLVGFVDEAALGRLLVPEGLGISLESLRRARVSDVDPLEDVTVAVTAPGPETVEQAATARRGPGPERSGRRWRWWLAAAVAAVAAGVSAAVIHATAGAPPVSAPAPDRHLEQLIGATEAPARAEARPQPADAGAGPRPAGDAGPAHAEEPAAVGGGAPPADEPPQDAAAPALPAPGSRLARPRAARPATPPGEEPSTYRPPILGAGP